MTYYATMPKGATYEGKPCKKGHTLRYVNSRNCVQCTRQATRRRKSR